MISADFGAQLPAMVTPPPGVSSGAMASRLRAVESRNITRVTDRGPVFWEEALGANVRDADGNVYLDLTGAFGVALGGHTHPEVVAAVRRQAELVVHGMGDVHPSRPRLLLMERLRSLAPWAEARGVLASTGSEAVEIALKTAMLASGRPGLLAFEGAYHGLTGGALAVTHRPLFRRPFECRLYPGVAFSPFPVAGAASADDCLERVAELLATGAPNGDPIGAVIVEPVQGRAGVRVPPEGFMEALSGLAREHDVLVIADEVFTGMGRCGAMFASDVVGLEPDVVCLGKALGAGMPLSACLGSRPAMDAWPDTEGEAVHTSTYLGHPLACAAALAALEVAEREDTPARARSLGARLHDALARELEDVSCVREVRGLGLFLAVELADAEGRPFRQGGVRVAEAALREGVIALPAGPHGEVVELAPPVTLTEDQVACAVEILARAVRSVAP